MDNQRLFAWALFGLMLMFTWQAWQRDYASPPPPVAESAANPALAVPDIDVPTAAEPAPGDDVPALTATAVPTSPAEAASNASARQTVQVTTDVLDIEIDLNGGDIVVARLPNYPIDKDNPDVPVQLLSDVADDYAVFRTGLTSRDPDNAPSHRASFTAAASSYALADGSDELVVPLTWQGRDGLAVTKTYRFKRGQYAVDLAFEVDNGSSDDWTAASYARIVHKIEPADRSMFDVESYSFRGPVVFDGNKYDKHSPGDLADDPVSLDGVTNGWVAAIEHHFLSAIVPPAADAVKLQATLSGNTFVAGTVNPPVNVGAGERVSLPMTLFIGPKLQDQLSEVSPRLDLTVDYGILTLLAAPLFTLLAWIQSIVGNWGWAIVIVTVLIKLVFYKLTEKSGRSMAKMRRLQPRMKAIQDRYKDDRQKLSVEMMELYKREKINPAAGCLPILIQMPFFLAFYWVLLESVEMRQAPFMLWIQDLSSKDPFFILPLAMGAAMFLQQKSNPAPADPVQAKVMKILPIVFTVFFAFFPAGLVLYWFTNTLLGAAQQWKINRVVEAEEKSARS